MHFSHKWSSFTPRAILEFTPADGILLYGGVSTGFKGGGWSLTSTNPLAAVTPLEPEKSTSYELGTKLRLFDNRLVFNVIGGYSGYRSIYFRQPEMLNVPSSYDLNSQLFTGGGTAPHSTVTLGGTPRSVGGVTSCTVIDWLTGNDILPERSVAIHG